MAFIDPTLGPYVASFLFVFGVVFGLLSYMKVGGFDKRINAMISLAFALFALFYPPLIASMLTIMPVAVLAFVALFFILFMKKMFDSDKEKDALPMMVALSLTMATLLIIGDRLIGSVLPSGFDVNNVMWGIGVLIVIMFFWAAYKHPQGHPSAPGRAG